MRSILPLVLVLTGCLSPSQTWQEAGQGVSMGGGPSDMTYLLSIAPVTSGGLPSLEAWERELTIRYERDVEVEGVLWQPLRSGQGQLEPDAYGSGGDSLLYTGIAAATWAWKYSVTQDPQDGDRVLRALRGLWILTHAAGPGVLCRCAFPVGREAEWNYPAAWDSRLRDGFVNRMDPAGSYPDPVFGGQLPQSRFYTRATKDQLSGLVFGLANLWHYVATAPVPDATLQATVRSTVTQITADVIKQLRDYDWRIRDARGENDTSADDVDDLLKLALLAVGRAVGLHGMESRFLDEFRSFKGTFGILGAADRYNNLEQYYAHSLRAQRAFSIWLLDDDADRRSTMVEYSEKHWRRWTEGHKNAWLAFLWASMAGGDSEATAEGDEALLELMAKPTRLWSSPLSERWEAPGFFAVTFGTTARFVLPVYLRKPNAYFTWQKEPWDPGELPYEQLGLAESTGLDFLAPYWLSRVR